VRWFLPLLIVLPLAAAACGGGGKKTAPTTPAAPDPGKATIAALIQAAVHNDTKTLWGLLSKPSQQRLGPSYASFALASARQMERALKPFENKSLTPFISQSVSQQFGIVAIRSGVRALAFPLRHENGAWKIETPGPITIAISGPQPGSHGVVGQIGVEIHAPGPPGDGVLWLDGNALQSKIATGPRSATVFANLQPALAAGVHIAVAYAEEGTSASALAWTFTATKS
jgi:hypothetical protein